MRMALFAAFITGSNATFALDYFAEGRWEWGLFCLIGAAAGLYAVRQTFRGWVSR